MTKSRYDSEKDETRHAAKNEECCEEMADKYGWSLKQVEQTETDVLPVDCVFDGICEFPPSPMDLSQGEYLKEDKENA